MNKQAPLDFVEKYYTDDLAERNTPESLWALKWLEEVKGESVLSLGCGPNFYDDAQFFTNLPKEFVGIDLNENNIAFLKQSTHPEIIRSKEVLDKNHTNISLIVANIKEKQDTFINHFDTIYANGVLGMFQEDNFVNLLKLIHLYLKPGGVLIDVDWTDVRLTREKLQERESYEWYSTQGPSIQRINELLQKTGFTILKHEVYTVPDPISYNWGKIYGYVAKKIDSVEIANKCWNPDTGVETNDCELKKIK